jgi:hypothetical protein
MNAKCAHKMVARFKIAFFSYVFKTENKLYHYKACEKVPQNEYKCLGFR